MMKRFLMIVMLIGLICGSNIGKADINIIPKPVKAEEKQGVFTLNANTKIMYSDKNTDLKRVADLLAATIKEQYGITLKTEPQGKQKPANTILLTIGKTPDNNADAYVLNITPQGIVLTGKSAAAVFCGIQSIRQLMPVVKNEAPMLPAVHIEDYPRFEWRGMLFDNCRHIFSVDYIKKIIDEMAYYKLNKLHWHLTDDQGWRIEIKKYPRLAEIAAWRNGTQYGPSRSRDVDTIRYGGYYTQEQIKDIVAYATARYIEVIPEIEIPGHSVAAITAYNNLACGTISFETGKPFEVRKTWGVSKDLYCAGNDDVFRFLEDVFSEVVELFPSRYIHIGGDEAPHDAWEKCPKCQQRMKDEGLKSEAELQSYFVRRIEKFLASKGKKIIGWEEIMQGGISSDVAVMSWLGTASGVKAAKNGNKVIMCPYSHMYIDGYQASPDIEPLAIGYYTPLEKVYSFEPEHPDLTEAEKPFIMGVQANLWTEFIATPTVLEYMMYPRICAMAEVGWSAKSAKKWEDFKVRLSHEMLRFQRDKIGFRIPTPDAPSSVFIRTGETLELKNSWGFGEIRYTTDGTEPSLQSALYTAPISPKPGALVRSALFIPDGRRSSVVNTIVKEKSTQQNWMN